MRSHKRLAALLLSVCVLSACQSGQAGSPSHALSLSAPPASAVPKLHMKSAYTTTSASQAPIWAAKDGGFFEAEGLDVTLSRISALAAMLGAIQSGELPLAFVSGQPPIEASLQGGEFVIVAGFGDRMSGQLYTMPSITPPDQLKGKNLGTTALQSASHIQAQAALARLGISKGQVGFLATGGPPETLGAIQAGQIEGASFTPPESIRAREAGLRMLIDIGSLSIPTQQSAVITTRKYAREHPDVIERYVRATIRGAGRLIVDREFAITTIGKYAQIDDRKALEETVEYYTGLWSRDGFPSMAGIQQILDTSSVPGAKSARPEQFVDLTFVEKIKAKGEA
jgi:NitT/TauT family transport system substrate-binding protein